jgi:hypothetical protein
MFYLIIYYRLPKFWVSLNHDALLEGPKCVGTTCHKLYLTICQGEERGEEAPKKGTINAHNQISVHITY